MVPALKALSGLLKNHESALVDAHAPAPAAAAVVDGERGMDQSEEGGGGGGAEGAGKGRGAGGGKEGGEGREETGEEGGGGGSAGVIARAVFEELHLPALAQSIRQVREKAGRQEMGAGGGGGLRRWSGVWLLLLMPRVSSRLRPPGSISISSSLDPIPPPLHCVFL